MKLKKLLKTLSITLNHAGTFLDRNLQHSVQHKWCKHFQTCWTAAMNTLIKLIESASVLILFVRNFVCCSTNQAYFDNFDIQLWLVRWRGGKMTCLYRWRTIVDRNSELTTPSRISISQFCLHNVFMVWKVWIILCKEHSRKKVIRSWSNFHQSD